MESAPQQVSAVSQREIGSDTESYVTAMRACFARRRTYPARRNARLRDDLRGCYSSETGHLLLSTLHTVGAVNTIDRS